MYALRKACGFGGTVDEAAAFCPQVEALYPEKNSALWSDMGTMIGTDAFRTQAINWLSGAVQVPSESFDEMDPVGVDPRWETMGLFHDYLLGAFPLVHETLSLTKVNTYGLLYEWTGSDASLKPGLLAAHQDVVPVHPNTVNEWTHPPFSGYYDGERIWGRGSSDDKSGLIGIMITIENLIAKGFKPTRTIVMAFGFDEETSGLQGAARLGDAMLEIYGADAFAFIVDEGGGFTESYGGVFATPGVAEKGYLDLRVDVAAPGGHSSVPPAHTSIGIISALLTEIEKNPPAVHLSRDDIIYSMFQCFATHGTTVPKKLKHAIKGSLSSDKALRVMEKFVLQEPVYYSTITTTQAIDLINGGQVSAVVNHRISILSSVEETIARDTKTFKKLAKEFNLTYTSFGETISEGAPGKTLTLSDAFGNALVPAPRTPISVLSGTIKATYNSHRAIEGDDNIAVSPGMSTGNTDTRYYWKLSRHIFRYNHKNSYGPTKRALSGVHTVNENIEVEAFIEMIRFFSTLVLNADEIEL
ncbi:hypothetical protein CPB85DRAFT_1372686 [Mucidula mucida]|nr:hypothetical protein CPB85DRAFT_1372686 [Mucidula mucida]